MSFRVTPEQRSDASSCNLHSLSLTTYRDTGYFRGHSSERLKMVHIHMCICDSLPVAVLPVEVWGNTLYYSMWGFLPGGSAHNRI